MKKGLISLALISALASASSHADIQISGYGSIVGGSTTSSDENLYGYDNNFDFKEGSLFALQATSDLGDGLGVTVQLQAKGTDDWDPEFKWAYISYDATENLRILAGKQRAPFFMYSDYLDVSYAYPWITPPTDLYSDAVFDAFDGLGAIYTTNFGEVDATFHGIYGRNTDTIDEEALGGEADSEFSNIVGLATSLTYDWLTLRAGYFTSEVTIPFSTLEAIALGWNAAGFDEIANQTRIEDDRVNFLEVGFQVNLDQVIIVGEYTQIELENTAIATDDSYYIMAGYQFDQVLVHLTYGADEENLDYYATDVPSGVSPALDSLIGATESVVSLQNTKTNYVTAGVRYDFHDSAALKFEYTAFSDDYKNAGGDAGLFRMALVTVF